LGAGKAWLLKRLGHYKEGTHWTREKIPKDIHVLTGPNHPGLKDVMVLTCERFCFETRQGTLFANGLLRKCFLAFSHPALRGHCSLVQGGISWHQTLVMMALQICRKQELQCHEGFHPDVKGKPGRPGNVWSGSLWAAPKE
jgi:hypothetical protein